MIVESTGPGRGPDWSTLFIPQQR